jgi:hypothetical protein
VGLGGLFLGGVAPEVGLLALVGDPDVGFPAEVGCFFLSSLLRRKEGREVSRLRSLSAKEKGERRRWRLAFLSAAGECRMSSSLILRNSLPSSFSLSLSPLSLLGAPREHDPFDRCGKKKRASTLATRTTHRPERLWRVTPLKTDVRDAGPREFFFSSAAPCVPPDDVAAEDISTISARRAQKVGRVAVWGARRGRPLCLLKMETSSVGAERGFRKKNEEGGGVFQRRFQARNVRLLAFAARESSDASVLQSTSAEWREESERRGSNADPMCPTLLAPPRDAAEEEAMR